MTQTRRGRGKKVAITMKNITIAQEEQFICSIVMKNITTQLKLGCKSYNIPSSLAFLEA
jgi:hypothetical protein